MTESRVLAGRYRLLRELGRGGMGVVYEALDTREERPVAVKILAPAQGTDPSRQVRFLAEARVAAALEHPGIVRVLDLGADGDLPFIVQELLTGESLAARLARVGSLPAEAVRALGRELLAALEAAHARGVIHRDIKPSNLLLCVGEGTPEALKVIDFGIARQTSSEALTALTETGQVLGTPGYMAPEQLRGEHALDARADLWSVGAVLFEALAGRRPFEAPNHNVMVFRVLSGRRTRLRELCPDAPEDLTAAIEKALEPDLSRRHASAVAFRQALTPRAPPPAIGRRALVWAALLVLVLVPIVGATRGSEHPPLPRTGHQHKPAQGDRQRTDHADADVQVSDTRRHEDFHRPGRTATPDRGKMSRLGRSLLRRRPARAYVGGPSRLPPPTSLSDAGSIVPVTTASDSGLVVSEVSVRPREVHPHPRGRVVSARAPDAAVTPPARDLTPGGRYP